jgi:hypothetical protein
MSRFSQGMDNEVPSSALASSSNVSLLISSIESLVSVPVLSVSGNVVCVEAMEYCKRYKLSKVS